MPDTSWASDALELARQRAGGMCFGFRVRTAGERWVKNLRELRALDLVEVSIVSAWPAYDDVPSGAAATRLGGTPTTPAAATSAAKSSTATPSPTDISMRLIDDPPPTLDPFMPELQAAIAEIRINHHEVMQERPDLPPWAVLREARRRSAKAMTALADAIELDRPVAVNGAGMWPPATAARVLFRK